MPERVVCKKCVMDKSDPDIVFDDRGVCNHCHSAQRELSLIASEMHRLPEIIEKIKKDGKGKKYDCLIGLSGGVDSSTALYHAVKFGLRPLAYSVDNGWQSDVAQENIMNLVEGLKVPFIRYTIDLERFADLQMAFIKAGQKNIEIPTDHILMATTYEMASKYGIKWVLSGGNVTSESIMPASWGYQPRDLVHIKDVYKWATGKKLKGLPVCSLLKFNYYKWIKRIRLFYILDYLSYNREESSKILQEKFSFKTYGEKHCESVFTSWFQNFYLFEKFGIDKRKAHYSSLINSKQLSKKEALEMLGRNPEYPKLELEKYARKYPPRPYSYFKTDEKIFGFVSSIIKAVR